MEAGLNGFRIKRVHYGKFGLEIIGEPPYFSKPNAPSPFTINTSDSLLPSHPISSPSLSSSVAHFLLPLPFVAFSVPSLPAAHGGDRRYLLTSSLNPTKTLCLFLSLASFTPPPSLSQVPIFSLPATASFRPPHNSLHRRKLTLGFPYFFFTIVFFFFFVSPSLCSIYGGDGGGLWRGDASPHHKHQQNHSSFLTFSSSRFSLLIFVRFLRSPPSSSIFSGELDDVWRLGKSKL